MCVAHAVNNPHAFLMANEGCLNSYPKQTELCVGSPDPMNMLELEKKLCFATKVHRLWTYQLLSLSSLYITEAGPDPDFKFVDGIISPSCYPCQ